MIINFKKNFRVSYKLNFAFAILFITFLTGCGALKESSSTNQEDGSSSTNQEETRPVFATGQTKSYDENGNEVTDGTLKDDGYYQAGIQQRSYSRSNDIVTDNITHLMWQDDSNVSIIKKTWLSDENYNKCNSNQHGPECYDTSGDTAATYCEELTLNGYSDWRLPYVNELFSLVDLNSTTTTHTNPIFEYNIILAYSANSSESLSASVVSFQNAMEGRDGKDYSTNVRCVRGNETKFQKGKFTEDNNSKIITDTTTNLMWQYNTDIDNMSWIDAIYHCEDLTINTYSDWRLPNVNELSSLLDVSNLNENNDYFEGPFFMKFSRLWSSTTAVYGDKSKALRFIFSYGESIGTNKDLKYQAICVRSKN